MEYLFLAIILYFIVRTTGNLVRLLARSGASETQDEQREGASRRGHGWEGPSPRRETGTVRDEPTFWGEDIEDATWHEVEEGARNRRDAPR